MNCKTKRISIITFFTSLFLVCFFNLQLAKAQTLPTRYDMDVKFDVSDKTLTGKEEIIIKNSSGKELKNLVFHLYADSYNKKETMPAFSYNGKESLTDEQKGDIDITKVIVNSKEVKFTQDNQLLKMKLDNSFKNNEEVKVSIQFTLKMPKGTNRLGYMNDVYSFTNWYPILSMYDPKEDKWDENAFHPIGESNYSDVSDYNINIKLPKDFTVASTGKQTSEDSDKDTKVLKLSATNVRDFVFIMSPYFKVLSKDLDGIKINSYYLSKDQKSESKVSAQKVLDITADAVKFFSEKFGKYPYDNLDMVETYLTGGAMEYPELVQMPKYYDQMNNSDMIYDDVDYISDNPFIYQAAVHEVGHQWWYVTVGDNEFKESFLDESITSFSTAYYFDKTEGEYSPNGIAASLRRRVLTSESASSVNSSATSINSSVDKFKNMMDYDNVIYNKGALLFEDLRKMVGEDKFLDIIRTYFEQYKFKNGSIDGVLDIIEKKAGKSVRDYINTSLNDPNYSAKNLKLSSEETQKLSKEQLKIRIKNTEAKNGIVFGSIYLKLMNGEKVIVAIPDSLSKEDKEKLISTINIQTKDISNSLVMKDTKDLTEADLKNNNLLFMGDPWNCKALSSIVKDIPITPTKTGIRSKNFSIDGNDISGSFIMKNPLSEGKLIFVSFGQKESNSLRGLDIYKAVQFSIYVDGKQSYSGQFLGN